MEPVAEAYLREMADPAPMDSLRAGLLSGSFNQAVSDWLNRKFGAPQGLNFHTSGIIIAGKSWRLRPVGRPLREAIAQRPTASPFELQILPLNRPLAASINKAARNLNGGH